MKQQQLVCRETLTGPDDDDVCLYSVFGIIKLKLLEIISNGNNP